MFKRFYITDPKHEIDEEFCQNGAKVAIEMEGKPVEPVDKKEYMEAFVSSLDRPSTGAPMKVKEGFIRAVLNKMKGLR